MLDSLEVGDCKATQINKRYIHKDGSIIWVSVAVSAIKNERGVATQFISQIENIGYKKIIQEALQKSEQEYRSLFEQNPFGVFSLNSAGYFTSANHVLVTKLNISKEQFTKTHYDAFLQPQYAERAAEKLALAFKGQPQKDVVSLITNSGEKIIFSLIILPIVVNKKITGVYGIANDITTNKATERALIESEDNLRTILECTNVGYILINREMNIASFNQAANKFSQFIKAENFEAGNSILNLFPTHRQSQILETFNNILEGNIIAYEKEFVNRDGKKRWYKVSCTPVINSRHQTAGIVIAVDDITEQKTIAADILTERNQLRTLIDNIPDAVYIKDSSARKILTNKVDLEFMGVTSEADVLGKTDRDIFHYKKMHIGYNDDMDVLTSGTPIINREEIFCDKNNLERWLLTTKVPLKNSKGAITGLLGIGRDITAQKNSQAEMERSNERFELVTKATFDAVWDWDIVNNQLYRGEGFEKIFGYSYGSQLAGLAHWDELIHPEDRCRVLEKFNKVIEGSETKWQDEFRYLRADGTYAFVIDKSIIVKDKNGKSIRMTGAMQDVTAKKEEELRLKLFESVIKNIKDAVLITEAEPIEGNGPAILFINDAFTNFTGYTLADVIGKTPRMLQGPKTDRKELEKIKKALKKWQPVEVDLLNYKKNGEEFWVNISIMPLANETGYFTHWISIQKDITIKKKAAEETDFFYSLLAVINTNNSFDSILSNAIEKIARYLGFDAAEAWTSNFVKSKIVFRSMYKEYPSGEAWNGVNRFMEFEKGKGLQGMAVDQKKIIYWQNLNNSPFVRKTEFANAGLESGMAVPVFFDGEVIALFCFYGKKPFTHQQLTANILTKISNQLGASIQKNRTEAELNSFFSLSPDMLSIIGVDGFFKKVNPAFTKIIGYTEEEFLSIPQIEFVHPADWTRTSEETRRLSGGGKPAYFENRYITKQGQVKWLAWSFTAVLEEELVFAVAKDISYSKKLESEKSSILESISDYFYALDAGFNFTYINTAAAKLMGATGDSLIGKNLWEVVPELKNSLFYDKAIVAIQTTEPVHFEFFYEPGNTWFEESFYPAEEGLSVFFRSVNIRKQSEARLNELNAELARNTTHLIASNAELERFAYVASHDLQEPLRMVSGFMQLLQKKYEPVLDEDGKKYIDFAIDGAARMKTLIHDLLHYSKAGSGAIEIMPVDMNDIMADIKMILKTTISTTATILFAEQLPVVNANALMVTQLMQNLVSNAIKYQTKDNQPVIKISCFFQTKEWVFSVEDNGIGITAGYEEKVFEVFQRLHTRQQYNGSGIGLSICKKIVEKLGGKIWVEAGESGGSIFRFTIPAL